MSLADYHHIAVLHHSTVRRRTVRRRVAASRYAPLFLVTFLLALVSSALRVSTTVREIELLNVKEKTVLNY